MNEIGNKEWYINELMKSLKPKELSKIPLKIASPSRGDSKRNKEQNTKYKGWASRGQYCRDSIYFLWDNNEIVYIGKTNSIYNRIGTHKRDPSKNFNYVSAFHVLTGALEIENKLIKKYKPQYNKQGK